MKKKAKKRVRNVLHSRNLTKKRDRIQFIDISDLTIEEVKAKLAELKIKG